MIYARVDECVHVLRVHTDLRVGAPVRKLFQHFPLQEFASKRVFWPVVIRKLVDQVGCKLFLLDVEDDVGLRVEPSEIRVPPGRL